MAASGREPPVIFVVDDDSHIREGIRGVLKDDGCIVEDYATCEAFLEAFHPGREGCLLIDAYLPGMSGLELLRRLNDSGHQLPSVMITGNSDVQMVIDAMKAGASDFIEKPVSRNELLDSIERALEQFRDSNKLSAWREAAASRVAGLTPRQRQIMDMVLAGHPSKNIAADLGISQRTVENHRAAIMKKDWLEIPAGIGSPGNGGQRLMHCFPAISGSLAPEVRQSQSNRTGYFPILGGRPWPCINERYRDEIRSRRALKRTNDNHRDRLSSS